MFGKVNNKAINKMGLPYAIIKGNNGITYYCDNRGMENGKVEDLEVGAKVEFVSYKDKKGKLIATHLKCVKSDLTEVKTSKTLEVRDKERIGQIIVAYVTQTGPVALTKLNIYLLNNKGVDYHEFGYAKPKVFLKENFSDILDFDDKEMNGCPQTMISLRSNIRLSGDTETMGGATGSSNTEFRGNAPSIYEEFDKLIEEEDYEGALRSNLFRTSSPDKLSIDYIEKAVLAAKKLLGMNENFRLSDFDKELITAPMSKGLFALKKETSLMEQGKIECYKKCDVKSFRKYFNALGETNTHNTTYLHIAIRFQTVCNLLYLPFYVLAAYSSKKNDVINEYYKFTQSESKFDYFNAINKIFYNTILDGHQEDSIYITKVLSTALDSDRFDLFSEFCKEVLGATPALIRWIEDDELQCDKIVDMLSPNSFFKPKVVEKYINYYMYKKMNDGNLSNEMINMLSEIAYAYPISYLEEILANNSYARYGRVHKRDLLVNNFLKITELIKFNPKAYVLACFVIENFMGDDVELPEEYIKESKNLLNLYAEKIKHSPATLYEFYPLYKVDASGRNTIEELFCDYLDSAYPSVALIDDCKSVVQEFNRNNCSFATVYFIDNRDNRNELLSDREISSLYLTALKNNTNYAKAIKYVKESNDSSENKKRELIRILYMNFKEFGVSPRAYDVFDDSFTLEVAETLALEGFMPTNGTPIILMGIYKRKNDLARVLYLYSIFYESTKTGNRTFYSQLYKYNGKISSMNKRHYKAFRIAFNSYGCDELNSFVDWASKIIIDGSYTSSQFEICKSEIDRLIKKPCLRQNWEAIINKLAKEGLLHSTFGYAFQCAYLTRFYNFEIEAEKEVAETYVDQLTRFASFSKVNETTNFISLNIKMIDVLPVTYVIKFAEFFERNSSILVENKEIDNNDLEKLYLLLLQKYNDSYEEEYLKLAVKYYDVFASRFNPHLELYKNFCRSSSNKTMLFRMLFKQYSNENAIAFHEFVYYNDWNCTDEENLVLRLLRIVYSIETDELPIEFSCFPARLLRCFKRDVSLMLCDYPRLSGYNTLMSNDETLAYKYCVLKYVMQVAFDQNVYWDVSDKYWDVCNRDGIWKSLRDDNIDGISAALGFFKVSYAKQCKHVQSLGIEYITRRYNNLYLIDLYESLVNGNSNAEVSDEYIIGLMRENNHISLIYDKEYKVFKSTLNDLCSLGLTADTQIALLASLIRGSLCPLVENVIALAELCNNTALCQKIRILFEKTGYPSVAQSALYLYFHSERKELILEFCKSTLPSTYNAIIEYNNLPSEEYKIKMREFIDNACTEMDHKKFLLSVIGNKDVYYEDAYYETYKPILINVIVATVFNYNIIRDLGNIVRQGKVSYYDQFFRDLLAQMDEESVYWYLCSIRYALNEKKEDAISAFYKVGGKTKVPELWVDEYENLGKYVNGEIKKFKTLGIYNDFSAQKETVIGNTILVDIALASVNEDITQANAKSAMNVFVNSDSTPQEKLNAAASVLSFVKNDAIQFIQNISEKTGNGSAEKMTYNEFLFEYGLLVIKSRKILADKKVDVIVELFGYFELLNDKNRRKFEENLKNAFVSLFATVKSKDDVVSYEQWLDRYDDIKDIVEKHKIHFEGYDFFVSILNKCIDFENTFYTVMDKIRFLESLPEGFSVEPITKNFLTSAKKELEKLQNGVMAKISIINHEIEDKSIFVVLENIPQSHMSVDLTPAARATKFVVNVFNTRTKEKQLGFESECSGKTEIIRPGQISGERILLPDYITDSWEDGDIVDITIILDVNGTKICSNINSNINEGVRFTYTDRTEESGIVAPQRNYETSSCAFTKKNKGYGRRSDREWLDATIPTGGLSIIYGPSRVGKSSLLSYIGNFLADDYKHKKGSFSTTSKKTDVLYVISHEENYHEMPDTDKEILDFLFLAPIRSTLMSIVESDMIDSEDMDDDNISREAAEQILKYLEKTESDLPFEKKLKTISKVLSNNNAEIWVLIDEFQQVVEKYPITQSVLFMNLCKQLNESIDNIRYILCGADEVVKLMINGDPILFKYRDRTRAIGQFTSEQDKSDFIDMLCDIMVWGSTGHPFTIEALNYIFTYTGGNALYGKLIGNRVIDAIKEGKFKKRKKIYPYDISSVVAQMLSKQKNDIHATSDVNEFISNVTKNLEEESPYLAYIASLMMKEPDRTRVTSSEIYEYFGALTSNEKKKEIDTALLLCSVRGILNSSEENGESVYAFSTTFYLVQYCEIVKRNGVPDRVSIAEEVEDDEDENQDTISVDEKLLTYFSGQSPLRQAQLIGGLLPVVDDSAKENVRKVVGDWFGGDKYHQEVHISAQTINTAFTTLLTPGVDDTNFLAAFNALPKLTSYFVDDQRKKIQQGSQQLLAEYTAYDSCFDETGECIDEVRRGEIESRIIAREAEMESLSAPAERKLLSDTVGAVVNSDDFMTLSEDRWQKLLGLKDASGVAKLRSLPSEFVAPLTFAVVLHNVFDSIRVKSEEHKDSGRNLANELDYCPVAIMYCKIVEAMLKQCHTPMYIRNLPDGTLKLGGSTTFKDLGTPDDFDSNHKDLSIGSFSSHLVYLPKGAYSFVPQKEPEKSDFRFKSTFKSTKGTQTIDYKENIRKLIANEESEEELMVQWMAHARALKIINEIRNRSAHEAVSITKENFDWLIKVLFKQGELLKIWELAEK